MRRDPIRPSYVWVWIRQVLRPVVFDALENTGVGRALPEEARRRFILPGLPCPAVSLCAARSESPVVCTGFGFDRFIYVFAYLCCLKTHFEISQSNL